MSSSPVGDMGRHHLRDLRAAGVASSRREGRTVLYALTDEGGALFAAPLPEPAALAP